MTRKGELDDLVDLSHLSIDYYEYAFASMNHGVLNGWFPTFVGENCKMCSYMDKCPAWGSKDFPLQIPTTGKEKERK